MYEFTGVIPENYILKASTTKPVGGIDIDDLWDVYGYLYNGNPPFSGIFFLATDFNNDGIIDIDHFWDLYYLTLAIHQPAMFHGDSRVSHNC